MELKHLLSSMRENALLYQNIEAEYVVERETLLMPEQASPSHYIRHGEDTNHVIFQGLMYYNEERSVLEMMDGSHRELISEIGYDGEVTRINEQGTLGNINYSRVLPVTFFPPNRLGYTELNEYELADFIEFSPPLSTGSHFLTIRSLLLGTDRWNGHECVKVQCDDYGRPPEAQPRASTYLWIYPSRNYLP